MTKSGKKGANKFGNKEDEAAKETPALQKNDPPKEDSPKGNETPIVTQAGGNEEVMAYLKTLGAQMTAVNERMASVEKRHRSRGSRRRTRKGRKAHHDEEYKATSKKLMDDFNDVASEKTMPEYEEEPEWEEDFSEARKGEGSRQGPALSEGRSISVFDRLGKKLTEHDLRIKLEKINADKGDRRPPSQGYGSGRPPSQHREREQSHRHGPETGWSPPRDHRRRDHRDDQEESSIPKKGLSQHDSTGDRKKEVKVGDLKIEELKKLIDQMNSEKGTLNPMAAVSPFTQEIRAAPLPPVFRSNNPDLTYNGDTDPVESLIRFNTEMEVYQVSVQARCKLFAASLRGSAQQWFSKLGSHVTINSWEQFADIFIKQF